MLRRLILILLACSFVAPFAAGREGDAALIALTSIAGGVTLFSLLRRQWPAAHLGLIISIGFVWSLLAVWPRGWPLQGLVPLIGYVAVVVVVRPLQVSLPNWFRFGTLSRPAVAYAALAIAGAAVALPMWTWMMRPDFSAWAPVLPEWHWVALGGGAIGFALLNGALEESIYRGIFLSSLGAVFSVRTALVGQAIAFGVIHLHGVPSGGTGIVLTTLYGVVMGILRIRAGGVGIPIVVHALADLILVGVLINVV